MTTYTIGLDAGWTVAVATEGATAAQALAALRGERHECADPVRVVGADGYMRRECDGCYAALAEIEEEPGLWLCGRCRS